jgi:hypothetical protein
MVRVVLSLCLLVLISSSPLHEHLSFTHPDKAVSRNILRLPIEIQTSNLKLRGGQADQEEAYARYEKNIKDLEAAVDGFDRRIAEDFPPEDTIGMSPRGMPMGSVPNPSRCVVYDEPKSVESLEPENWQPNEQSLEEAMKAVDWMESVAKEMSPEGMEKMLNARGYKLEDLRPKINSLGTRMGNLTAHEQVRVSLLEQVDQIRTTYALLRHEMSQVSPVDELKKEIDEVFELFRGTFILCTKYRCLSGSRNWNQSLCPAAP